jgi:hypothetical protein
LKPLSYETMLFVSCFVKKLFLQIM